MILKHKNIQSDTKTQRLTYNLILKHEDLQPDTKTKNKYNLILKHKDPQPDTKTQRSTYNLILKHKRPTTWYKNEKKKKKIQFECKTQRPTTWYQNTKTYLKPDTKTKKDLQSDTKTKEYTIWYQNTNTYNLILQHEHLQSDPKAQAPTVPMKFNLPAYYTSILKPQRRSSPRLIHVSCNGETVSTFLENLLSVTREIRQVDYADVTPWRGTHT